MSIREQGQKAFPAFPIVFYFLTRVGCRNFFPVTLNFTLTVGILADLEKNIFFPVHIFRRKNNTHQNEKNIYWQIVFDPNG